MCARHGWASAIPNEMDMKRRTAATDNLQNILLVRPREYIENIYPFLRSRLRGSKGYSYLPRFFDQCFFLLSGKNRHFSIA
jgi:hypothetical protein